MAKHFLNRTSKGSFCSKKKIVKVVFSGVAVCESRGLLELHCGAVKMWGSQCEGVVV